MAVAGLALHADHPRCLIHSDVHPGNWYLTGDGQPGLLDWQCLAKGNWARDIAYAMSALMDVPVRRAKERELLDHYLKSFADKGGPDLSFNFAWQSYCSQLPAALLMWTPTLCHPATMPDMQPPEVSIEMIRRITHAIEDVGLMEHAA